MKRVFTISAVLVLLLLFQGCTIHFKGESVEFDAEHEGVVSNHTYELEKVDIFSGQDS